METRFEFFASRCKRENQSSQCGFEERDDVWQSLTNLFQNDGTFITAANTTNVGAPLNTINYVRIDLTQTELRIGDSIRLNVLGNRNVVRTITGITNNSIILDRDVVAAYVPTPIEPAQGNSTIQYCKSKPSRRTREFQIVFKPRMGIFDVDQWFPGDWMLTLHPHTQSKFKKFVIESLVDKTAGADFDVVVQDLQLHVWKGMTSGVSNGVKEYEWNEIRVQKQTVTNSSLQNKTYTINPKTHTLSLAFQKPNAGDDSRFPRNKFISEQDNHLKLQVWQMRLDGKTLPIPTPQIEYDRTLNVDKDYTTQYYYEYLMYSRAMNLDDPESLREWQERGPIYTLKLREKIQSSNRLVVSSQFSNLSESISQLIFDHHYKRCRIHCENGMVSKVEVQ